MSNDQKRADVAERMSKTIGLPSSSVNALMGEFTDEDVERLCGLDDTEFKQESVKLVNKAQQRQFANMSKPGAAPPAAAPVPAPPAAAPVPAPPAAAPVPAPPAAKPVPTPPAAKPVPAPPAAKPVPTPPAAAPVPPTPAAASVVPQASGTSERKKLVIPMATSSSTNTASGLKVPTVPGSSGLVLPSPDKKKKSPIEIPTETIAGGGVSSAVTPGTSKKLQINMKDATSSKAVENAATQAAEKARKTESVPVVSAVPTISAARAATPIVAAAEPASKGLMASGIKAVEPDIKVPLNISPQEKKLLEEEVPHMVREADLPEDGHSKEVSGAFTGKKAEENALISKKNLPMLVGAGVGGLLVVGLLLYLVFTMLFKFTPSVENAPPPVKPKNNVPKVGNGDARSSTEFVGKWAWKHDKNFKETFENGDLLPGRVGTVFTIDMWISFRRVTDVQSVSLSAIGEKFSIGMTTYGKKPMVFFDVPEACLGKGGVRVAMPTGTGWLHLAGVYDPVDAKNIRFYVNGKKVGVKQLKKDPPLPASIFIFRGKIGSNESHVLIDGVRMTNAVLYTDDFEPVRNMTFDMRTAALFRMEKKVVANMFEIPNVAHDKKAPARFTSGEFVEVDSVNFKLAINRAAELERMMFDHYREKWSPERFDRLKKMWPKAPRRLKTKYLGAFEEVLEAQELEKKKAKQKEEETK